MKIWKYIVCARSGECIGKIVSENRKNMREIESSPDKFGFEPIENDKNVLWAKYYKKDIFIELAISSIYKNHSEMIKILGIVIVKKYYVLCENEQKLYWKKQ